MTTRRKGEPKGAPEGVKVVVQNRRARFDYAIEDRYEAGLVLSGSEVKSLRAGNVSLSDAYAQPRGGELFLLNCRIGEYQPAAYFGHSPLRDRKLLDVGKISALGWRASTRLADGIRATYDWYLAEGQNTSTRAVAPPSHQAASLNVLK